MTNTTGHGAFLALDPSAREIVPRRMMMRDAARDTEARMAAARWLQENGTRPDRIEAERFLRKQAGGERYA